jgi:dolichol-phosphate mannosyltransferase
MSNTLVKQKPVICVVTPIYNEQDNLRDFEKVVVSTLFASQDFDFHCVLVDDGSMDGSWAVIKEICARDNRFRALRLSRNYGAHVALTAGIANAEGDAVTTLACDLQDPPKVIVEFAEKWRRGAMIVWGKRRSREDTGWRIVASNFFFFLLKRYAMPKESKFTTGSFLLADRKVIEAFKCFSEHNRITFALIALTGFDQEVVEYDRVRRIAGKSGWNFSKMIKTMYDALIGFSQGPIKLITLAGGMIFISTAVISLYIFGNWILMAGKAVPGWTSLTLLITGFFGIQFLLMGIMGEYLSRIYIEATRRPLYFISESTHESTSSSGNNEKFGTGSVGKIS